MIQVRCGREKTHKAQKGRCAATALCVGIALGVLAVLPSGPGVTKANFDRIEEGMTRAEVDELFGGKVLLERLDQGWTWIADDGSEVWIGFRGDRDRVFAKFCLTGGW